jgi:hypothetical protein
MVSGIFGRAAELSKALCAAQWFCSRVLLAEVAPDVARAALHVLHIRPNLPQKQDKPRYLVVGVEEARGGSVHVVEF